MWQNTEESGMKEYSNVICMRNGAKGLVHTIPLTVGYIAKIAGVNETELRYSLQKGPKTSSFLGDVVETKEVAP